MLYLEESYQQQQVARKEQMKVFEQQYGITRTTRAADSKLALPVKTGRQQFNDMSNPTMHKSQLQLNMNGIADQGSSIEQAD